VSLGSYTPGARLRISDRAHAPFRAGERPRRMGGFAVSRFDRPVRCSSGHLFTTIWVPLGSLKAIRLGPRRLQWCPVGRHWSMVTALGPSATPEQLAQAAAVHDLRIF
jgi:hypothetical protein